MLVWSWALNVKGGKTATNLAFPYTKSSNQLIPHRTTQTLIRNGIIILSLFFSSSTLIWALRQLSYRYCNYYYLMYLIPHSIGSSLVKEALVLVFKDSHRCLKCMYALKKENIFIFVSVCFCHL